MKDYTALAYMLERVKAACPDRFGKFRTVPDTEEHGLCEQLENDGLIRRYFDEEEQVLWELK